MIGAFHFLITLSFLVYAMTLPTAAQRVVSIEQQGHGSVSTIDQSNAYDSLVDIFDISNGDVNALIEQEGHDHQVTITLFGEGHGANLSQKGSTNESWIDVSGANNIGRVIQDGHNNKAYLVQTDVFNDGSIHQYQSDNDASLKQSGNGNLGRITQMGGDRAYLSQEGSSNEALIDQSGGGNLLALRQIGEESKIEINQINGGNKLTLEQQGNNYAGKITQSGDARASIIQTEIGFKGRLGLESEVFSTSPLGELVPNGMIQVKKRSTNNNRSIPMKKY